VGAAAGLGSGVRISSISPERAPLVMSAGTQSITQQGTCKGIGKCMQQHVSNQLGALLQQPLSCRPACGAEGNQGDIVLKNLWGLAAPLEEARDPR